MSFLSLFTGSFRKVNVESSVFIETAPYEKGFAQYYAQHIKPHIDKFEKSRIKALGEASTTARIALPLLILLVIAAFYILENYRPGEFGIKMIVMFVFGMFAIAYFLMFSSINRYRSSIKRTIFPKILKFIGDYNYKRSCPGRVRFLKESNIIPDYDRETSEDSITGSYKGVSIDLFETKLEIERRNIRAIALYQPVFKGVLIHFSVNKIFKGKTLIRKDSGVIGNWSQDKSTQLENVKLKDSRFEKSFEVYSNDQVEARYLLTTSFMDGLLKLAETIGSKGIECSFYKNKLLIKIPVKRNMFEPGSIYKYETFVDDAKSLLKEMNLIFQIIDILKLDNDIGI